jgi:hypothetical protein
LRRRIEEGAKDVRSCELELPPKGMLRPALMIGASISRIARSARSGRVTVSSNSLRMTGPVAAKAVEFFCADF